MKGLEKQYEWDGEVPDHAPDLYDFAALAEPLNGFAAVDEAALARYHEQGFLAIENAFSAADITNGINGIVDLIAEKNPDFSIIQFHTKVRDQLASLTLEERLNHVRKIGQFTEHDQHLKDIAFHPALLAIVEKILGAQAELYQSMALIKPPHGREKPWHQDHAYFNLTLDTKVVGVWIALDEATVENGCMRMLPGWHHDKIYPHWQIRDWQLCDTEAQAFKAHCVAVPLKPGGCLLFDSFTPHGTPRNFTPSHRKALQYHYVPAGTLRTHPEERLAIWGKQVSGVGC